MCRFHLTLGDWQHSWAPLCLNCTPTGEQLSNVQFDCIVSFENSEPLACGVTPLSFSQPAQEISCTVALPSKGVDVSHTFRKREQVQLMDMSAAAMGSFDVRPFQPNRWRPRCCNPASIQFAMRKDHAECSLPG